MRSRSLAEGVGLSYGSDHFCIFREHKSGLWYVRKSDDLINQGMFVSLNGFEYQVYLDVQQVEDTVEGKYAKLNELLNGGGCPDLEVAWEEYRYKDLYAALAKFATPELFGQLSTLCTPALVLKAQKKDGITTEEIFAAVKKHALEYYEAESKFAAQEAEINKEQERFNLKKAEMELVKPVRKDKTPTQKEARIRKKATEATAAQRWNAFCKQIEYLAGTIAASQGLSNATSSPSSTRYKISNSALKANADNLFYEGINSNKNAAEILAAFAMVSSAGSANCLKWGYNRKLTELLNKAGFENEEMKSTFRKLFLMMKIRDFNFGASGQAKSTYETARLLTEGEYSWELTGANNFNGIRWFNKEKMESSLWYAFAAVSMYSPRILREHIHRLYRTLVAAKEGAQYQCEKFLEAVRPVQKKRVLAKAKTSKASKKSSEDSVNLEQK